MSTRNRRVGRKNTRTRQVSRQAIDPIKLGRMLQRRKAGGLILALVVIIAIAVLDRNAGLLPVADDWHRYHGKSFEVVRVIDGDTIDLRVPDGDRATTRVRLWGVNTPEMNFRSSETPPEPWAQEATDFVRDEVEGRRVTLRLQDHRLRERYGRLLAYVVLPDGSVLNAKLIEDGYSKHDGRWSHDRAADFDALEQNARLNKLRLWSD